VDFDALFSNIGQHTIDGLAKGAIYALVALGYTLVYGVLRLINFAHSEVFMVGTFAIMWTWTGLGITDNPNVGIGVSMLLLGALIGAAVSGGTAVLVELVAYRPLRRKNAPPLVFLITAIGVSLTLVEIFGLFTGRGERKIQGMPTIITSTTVLDLGFLRITNWQLIILVAAFAMMIALDQFINRTRYGRGVRAVAQNPDTAALMGVNKNRVIVLIFLLGGLMAGVAAVLWNMRYGVTKFDIGFVIGLKAFTAAVLGGIGNLRGALVGGLVLGVIEVYFATLTESKWEDVWAFVVLVIVLMFRPTGILGESLGRARA
jgi:branched-chain amino acid transport system permease protein